MSSKCPLCEGCGIIKEHHIFFDIGNGKKEIIESNALAVLLADCMVFPNDRKYVDLDGSIQPNKTIVCYLNCGDIFYYGADAEEITLNDLPQLLQIYLDNNYRYLDNNYWRLTKWLCLKRKMRPLKSIEDAMRKAKAWDSDMESLPERKDND